MVFNLITFGYVLVLMGLYELIRWSVLSFLDHSYYQHLEKKEQQVKVEEWKHMTLDHYEKEIKKRYHELYMIQKTPSIKDRVIKFFKRVKLRH